MSENQKLKGNEYEPGYHTLKTCELCGSKTKIHFSYSLRDKSIEKILLQCSKNCGYQIHLVVRKECTNCRSSNFSDPIRCDKGFDKEFKEDHYCKQWESVGKND